MNQKAFGAGEISKEGARDQNRKLTCLKRLPIQSLDIHWCEKVVSTILHMEKGIALTCIILVAMLINAGIGGQIDLAPIITQLKPQRNCNVDRCNYITFPPICPYPNCISPYDCSEYCGTFISRCVLDHSNPKDVRKRCCCVW
ncbi:unnamed protein product [Lactuca saligna]|uniref:Uncharacterized protein n=1 Tax=Lactuca saligna TaxID=75948 RepID=A0AA35Z2P0_LACSI|nr:unnamed protein product [Lactuca saligna]